MGNTIITFKGNLKTVANAVLGDIEFITHKVTGDNKQAILQYQVIEPTAGEVLYTKLLRYDNIQADTVTGIKEYPSYDDWFAAWNDNQFLINEFFAKLTADEKLFISLNQ